MKWFLFCRSPTSLIEPTYNWAWRNNNAYKLISYLINFYLKWFSQVSYVSNRANIYLSMKKWEEAEKDASKAIEMDPKNAKVIVYILFLGECHWYHKWYLLLSLKSNQRYIIVPAIDLDTWVLLHQQSFESRKVASKIIVTLSGFCPALVSLVH